MNIKGYIFDFMVICLQIFLSMIIARAVLSFITWGKVPFMPRPYGKTLTDTYLPYVINSMLIGIIFSGISVLKPDYISLEQNLQQGGKPQPLIVTRDYKK